MLADRRKRPCNLVSFAVGEYLFISFSIRTTLWSPAFLITQLSLLACLLFICKHFPFTFSHSIIFLWVFSLSRLISFTLSRTEKRHSLNECSAPIFRVLVFVGLVLRAQQGKLGVKPGCLTTILTILSKTLVRRHKWACAMYYYLYVQVVGSKSDSLSIHFLRKQIT